MAKEEGDQQNEEKAPAESGGGIKVWIPLIATLIVMPATAFLLTKSVIIKTIRQDLGITLPENPEKNKGDDSEKGKKEGKGGKEGGNEEPNPDQAKLESVMANVAGTSGTRFVLADITLKGLEGKKITELVKEHEAQLIDQARGIIGSFSMKDLNGDGGVAGAANQAKAQLRSAFENVLGDNVIEAIYLPKFAIQ